MSRFRVFAGLIFVCIAAMSAGVAQQHDSSGSRDKQAREAIFGPPLPVVRDEQALQTVRKALNALGGTSAIDAAGNCTVSAQVTLIRPTATTKANETVPATWTISGKQPQVTGRHVEIEKAMAPKNRPEDPDNEDMQELRRQSEARRQLVPAFVAVALSREFKDEDYSLEYVGTDTLGGQTVAIVKTSSKATRRDAQITQQTWYFDTQSGLPVAVEYVLIDTLRGRLNLKGSVALSNYKTFSGVLYPMEWASSIAGNTVSKAQVSSVQVNSGEGK